MEITIFHWAVNSPPSIGRSFRPLIDILSTTDNVKEYNVPYAGSLPWNMLKNIIFVHKHRSKNGVNHITGDIHYCILGLIGSKSVLTIHDDYAMVKARHGFLDRLYKRLLWLYLPIRFASITVFISESTKEKIGKYVNLKKRNTMVFSHHSVNSEFTYSPKPFDKECPTILQIGASEHKNLETTIKAVGQLGLKCKLRIIKKMQASQHELAKSLGVDYSNDYDLTDEEIVEEYRKADIVVFPSLYEGFGMPIIEAQATGRPIITTNRAPMNMVAGGDSAASLLEDPLDVSEYTKKLEELILNASLRDEHIKNGLENAKKYTAQSAALKYKEIYGQI